MDASVLSEDEERRALLQALHPGWRIWRAMNGDREGAWCATNRQPANGYARTLVEDTADALEARLAAPPRGID
ncbi:hypothetical protein [Allonocardiopsis opalescens]|uniref:Uncharacterized protein n=1 Tax=Allonocardiopsis opalescens TaxID=1144618 RepID=A0A2T0QEG8_9ACTN|nr:hypothetical protein [Allonocardiopsis opalescens]PRY02327.1 hypothetical protein CLV72_101929 [Allonocardiopsis opalescens]